MKARAPSKLRLTAVIITLVASAAIAVLVACPPASPRQPTRQVVRAPDAPATAPVPAPTAAPTPAPVTAPEPAAVAAPVAVPRQVEPAGKLAVILDDAGYSLDELQPFLDLPEELTISVLPNLPHSAEAARRVLAAGKELILHCPMEAEGEEDPGPGALRVGMSEEQIDQLLAAAFASVPGARGMNNHMGSKATADPVLMGAVLRYLKREGKFFLDSRTSAQTVGAAMAARMGVPFLQRDLFIDDERSETAIADAFKVGVQKARSRGTAVVIGHVQNRGVLDILRAGRKDLADNGVRLARLDDVMNAARLAAR